MPTPTTLAQVIAQVESSTHYGALRFEPTTHARWSALVGTNDATLARIVKSNLCSEETAAMIASTSWGAFQIMGFNLYAEGSPVSFFSIAEFLVSTSLQGSYFGFFVSSHHIDYTFDDLKALAIREHFAEVYNGPGNVDAYAARIAQVMGNP